MGQFLGPENLKMNQLLFGWIFLVSIELIHYPKLVQIVFFFFYWPEFWRKKLLGPENEENVSVAGPRN